MDKCVLIYEDDIEILYLCFAILSKSNYRVVTMTSCEHVLTDIEMIKPNLILMDLWIPIIGGEKAIGIIKENITTRHIPVIIFSANAILVLYVKGYMRMDILRSHLKLIIFLR